MPKPLLNTTNLQTASVFQNLQSSYKVSTNISPEMLEKRLRSKRSKKYLDALKQLDINGSNMNNKAFEDFVSIMQNEFPEFELPKILVGIVSKCYLGNPYEVHTLDMAGQIIKHYKIFEALPPKLEQARSLALHEDYDFIEVYSNSMCAVKFDGTVAMIKL